MTVISNYLEHYRDQNYDRTNNPRQLPIKELLPIGLSWSAGNQTYRLDFQNGAVVHPLSDMSGIAVIEMERDQQGKSSCAYIINADGSLRFEIKLPELTLSNGKFYDVYYIGNDLCFFFYSDNEDFRMIYDSEKGIVKDILQSR